MTAQCENIMAGKLTLPTTNVLGVYAVLSVCICLPNIDYYFIFASLFCLKIK